MNEQDNKTPRSETWNTNPENSTESEYLDTDLQLQNFVKRLLKDDSSFFDEAEKASNFQDFLKQISTKIGRIVPFFHRGIGQSALKDQALVTLALAQSAEELTRNVIDNKDLVDCKLTTSLLGYILNWYFYVHQWPFEVGLITTTFSSHVHVIVRANEQTSSQQPLPTIDPNTYYRINYIPAKPDEGVLVAKIVPEKKDTIDSGIARGQFTFDHQLIKGIENFDQKYQAALDQENDDSSEM